MAVSPATGSPNPVDAVARPSSDGNARPAFAATSADASTPDRLLTPGEVAAMFRVDPKTVARWAGSGKLTSLRTLGGHRRYKASEVASLLEDGLTERDADDALPALRPDDGA